MGPFAADLLKDKVVLITGGATGLGRAMGEKFLELELACDCKPP